MNLPHVEEVANFEQKCPLVVVIDRSGSMEGPAIKEVNNGLKMFKKGIVSDPTAKSRLELAIISYDNNINVESDFTLLDNDTEMPTLIAGGLTYTAEALQKAIDIVEERKLYYKKMGLTYYRPYIVLLTDGCSSNRDALKLMATKIQNGIENRKFNFWAFGVENASMEELNMLGGKKSIIEKLKNVDKIGTFFEWLGNSMQQVSHSNQGDHIDLRPEKDKDPFLHTT